MQMHGDAHPNVGYFWRVEPDVIFAAAGSAPLSPLLIGAAHSLGDVLLPQTTSPGGSVFAMFGGAIQV